MRDNNSFEDNLIIRDDLPRDSLIYENEMSNFMVMHEGEQIAEDIQLLRDMGYDNRMINKIYILLRPESIERAIDYMTEVDGIFQHDFFENNYHTKDNHQIQEKGLVKQLKFFSLHPSNCRTQKSI